MLKRYGSMGASPATVARQLRSLGAIAHFDPSWGASDDGTTSTWIDRIGGNTVTSASTASRLIYSSSLASLNNRPGWSGTSAANSHLRNTGSTALGLAMAGVLPHTIYSVRRATLTTAAIYMSSSKSGVADYWYLGNLNSVNNSAYVRNQAGQTIHVGSYRHTTEAVIAVATFTGTTAGVYDNGGNASPLAANTKNIDTNNLCIGGLIQGTSVSLCFDGDTADLVVFPTAHTDAQRRYVEQLLATKYGWDVLQGVDGYTAANYFANAGLTSGIRGSNTNGVWADVLLRPNEIPVGIQYLQAAFVGGAGGTGQALSSNGASAFFLALNGTVTVTSTVKVIAAADVGKLALLGGAAGPGNLVRGFWNGAELNPAVAMTGYARNTAIAYTVGQRVLAAPASSYSLFGIAGGDVEQVAANQAARAAAIKSAKRFVATGGATPTHGWALNDNAATMADLVGSDTLTRAGSLSRAQIIMTEWPW